MGHLSELFSGAQTLHHHICGLAVVLSSAFWINALSQDINLTTCLQTFRGARFVFIMSSFGPSPTLPVRTSYATLLPLLIKSRKILMVTSAANGYFNWLRIHFPMLSKINFALRACVLFAAWNSDFGHSCHKAAAIPHRRHYRRETEASINKSAQKSYRADTFSTKNVC